jgi:hypothetical protein
MAGLAVASPSEERALRAWVREHEVCGEVSPHFEVHEGRKLHVGYRLTLWARGCPRCGMDPGCECVPALHEGLERIAAQVLPAEAQARIEPFEVAFHLRPETSWAPEVELDAEVLRGETFEPPDEVERRYPARMRARLKSLGIERHPRPRRGPPLGTPCACSGG